MAKKKQDLTPEERLAAALVPEEEWPYALPEGWKWVYLSGILDVSKEKTEEFPPDTKYVGLENIEKDTGRMQAVDAEGIRSTKNIFEAGNILYGKLRPYLNKHSIAEFDGVCSTDILVFQTAPSVEKELLNRYFDLPQFISFAVSHSKGINLPRVSAKEILTARMPLPPLSEQHRLVARIESLFAKLDAAREKVQSVLDSHETRKAALLHDAFTGKLTAKWREEQGESSHAWRIEKLENLCEKITCGKTPKNDISPQGEIPYLKVYNIVNDKIDFRSKPQYISRDVHETKLKSSILKPNDVIMNIVGPPLRKIAIIPDTYPEWNMNQAIVRFRATEALDYRFLYYTLLNPETLDDVIQRTKGVVGQANISITQSRNLKIKVPPLPEQQEIIRILGRLLAREQRARQAAEETLAAIDRMKQSILARAFRGEL